MSIKNPNRRQFTDEYTARFNNMKEERESAIKKDLDSFMEHTNNIKFTIEFNDGLKIDYPNLRKDISPDLFKALAKTWYDYTISNAVSKMLDGVFK